MAYRPITEALQSGLQAYVLGANLRAQEEERALKETQRVSAQAAATKLREAMQNGDRAGIARAGLDMAIASGNPEHADKWLELGMAEIENRTSQTVDDMLASVDFGDYGRAFKKYNELRQIGGPVMGGGDFQFLGQDETGNLLVQSGDKQLSFTPDKLQQAAYRAALGAKDFLDKFGSYSQSLASGLKSQQEAISEETLRPLMERLKSVEIVKTGAQAQEALAGVGKAQAETGAAQALQAQREADTQTTNAIRPAVVGEAAAKAQGALYTAEGERQKIADPFATYKDMASVYKGGGDGSLDALGIGDAGGGGAGSALPPAELMPLHSAVAQSLASAGGLSTAQTVPMATSIINAGRDEARIGRDENGQLMVEYKGSPIPIDQTAARLLLDHWDKIRAQSK